MKLKWDVWLKGIIAAFVGGGASAIISGLTSMGMASDKFNLTSTEGFWRLVGLMGANFFLNGIISIAFFLKQSPVPPESTGNTEVFQKPIAPQSQSTNIDP